MKKILTSCKDPNPSLLFQPTKNTLFRHLLRRPWREKFLDHRPYNQFKQDQEEEKKECKTEILEINGKAARRKFRMEQVNKNKQDKTLSEISITMTKSSTNSSEINSGSDNNTTSSSIKKKPVIETISFKLSDHLNTHLSGSKSMIVS